MMPTALTSKAPGVKLPFSFILTGILSFVLAQVLLLIYGNDLLSGHFRTPAMWAVAHLLLIGWASMVSMGAMYQLVPVAFQVRIRSEGLGYVQFIIMVIALLGFTITFFIFSPAGLVLFGSLLVAGFLIFLGNMLLSLRAVTSWNMMTVMVFASLLSLTLTIILGLILVGQLTVGGFIGQYHLALLYTHITLGLISWFSLLIFGFSYKMVPMFTLAHGYAMDISLPVFFTFVAGIFIMISSYFFSSSPLMLIGAVLLSLGFILFAYHVWLIWKKRMKRHPDLGFKYALSAIAGGVGASVLLVIVIGISVSSSRSVSSELVALSYLFLMGWISLSILGYLFKIIPFLWWTYKYSNQIGKVNVPTLKEMMDERLGALFFPAFILATLLVTISLWLKSATLFYTGQGLHVLSALLYAWITFSVFKK